jgi:hypothetical protein
MIPCSKADVTVHCVRNLEEIGRHGNKKNNKGNERKQDLKKGKSRWRRMKERERYNTCLKRITKLEGSGELKYEKENEEYERKHGRRKDKYKIKIEHKSKKRRKIKRR